MSAEIVNLRQARKRKARRDKEAAAAENRERFGQTKAVRELRDARQEKDRRDIDAHRREGDPRQRDTDSDT